jgi:hypothetical protein
MRLFTLAVSCYLFIGDARRVRMPSDLAASVDSETNEGNLDPQLVPQHVLDPQHVLPSELAASVDSESNEGDLDPQLVPQHVLDPVHAQSFIQLVQSAMSPVDVVKYDFISILRKDPKWENIAKYLILVDERGHKIFGLKPIKWLCKLLRRMASKFVVKDIKVDFLEDQVIESEWVNGKEKGQHHAMNGGLIAQWQITLNNRKSLFFFGSDEPIVIEAETHFGFNYQNQLSFVQIKNCFVNGFELLAWPEVDPAQKLSENMLRIQEWMNDVRALSGKMAPLSEDVFQGILGVGNIPSAESAELVVNTMKADFANIFRRQPSTWENFAENLTVVDHKGFESSGLESNRNLLQLLHKLPDKFRVRDFYVHFLEAGEKYSTFSNGKLKGKSFIPYGDLVDSQEGSFLLAGWKVKLGQKKGLAFWKKSTTIELEGEAVFQVNIIDDELKVDRVLVPHVSVNGKELEAWPEVDLFDNPANGLTAIKEWAFPSDPSPESADDLVVEAADDLAMAVA